jgi:uncharacterized protein (TIGR01777 family)
MKVLLTGASGFIGSRLSKRLEAAGHQVLPVSRRAGAGYDWSDESLARGVHTSDAVIHLAGENLFAKRWSASQKEILRLSRTVPTKQLAALIAEKKPACFISSSAVGYYGPNSETHLHEGSPHGNDFLAGLCVDWEDATLAASYAGVRTAIIRSGVVLGRGGGALAKMLLPFKLGMGGPLGSGKQWVSWVHIDDLISLFLFVLQNPNASGVFNGTAPRPVTMKEFSQSLGRALHRPAVFPVPAPILRLALGEVADILLTGQYVEPRRATEAGFRFQFVDIDKAMTDIFRREP